MTPLIAAAETLASTAVPATAAIATETLAAATPVATEIATASAVAAETTTLVPDIAAASAIEAAIPAATVSPTAEIATAQIANIASGKVFPTVAPEVKIAKGTSDFTKSQNIQNTAIVERAPSLEPTDIQFLEETSATLPEAPSATSHPENTDSPSEQTPEKNLKDSPEEVQEKPQEDPTKNEIEFLDKELQRYIEQWLNSQITEEELEEKRKDNEDKRKKKLDSLKKRYQEGDESMTDFEKQIAREGMKMQQLMQEIASAPKTFDAMEAHLKNLKDQYQDLAQFKINEATANSKEAQKNVAQRAYVADLITAQAAHMAGYAHIVERNVNDFIKTNSNIEFEIGVRNGLHHLMVNIGTGIKAKVYNIDRDIMARQIAKTGKMPG